jgi:hypothetical protein
MSLQIRQVGGGQRNVTFQISGALTESLPLTPVETGFKKLKLASLVWVIQEKMIMDLWWKDGELILPMESRNSVRFDTGLQAPETWDGTFHLSTRNWDKPTIDEFKGFLIVVDFDR